MLVNKYVADLVVKAKPVDFVKYPADAAISAADKYSK